MRWPWSRSRKRRAARSGETRLNLPQLPRSTYAIGDAHGCLALYRALEAAIIDQIGAEQAAGPALLVVLGDVVDRGPDTARLIDHLMAPAPAPLTRVVLRGNHEDMMLRFMRAPAQNKAWLGFGGRETLMSYGAVADSLDARAPQVHRIAETVIPPAHLNFLQGLPLCLTAGPYLFSHAGCDPAKPVEAQTAEDFMWSDPAQLDTTAPERICVHGHVPVTDVMSLSSRVAIDTGAYATGRLSAVKLGETGPERRLVASEHPVTGVVSVDVDDMV